MASLERSESPKQTLLDALVDSAVTKFTETPIGSTQEGESYPFNIKHASYAALLEIEEMGVPLTMIFPILAKLSRTEASMPSDTHLSPEVDLTTVICIEIVSSEALRLHPEISIENNQRLGYQIIQIHD